MNEIRIHRIINSETITIKELHDFLGEEVDILVTTRGKSTRRKMSVKPEKTAAASLSKYRNEQLIEKEAGIWEEVIKEKYANC
ncbi:MAG: hypothetical protein K9H64_05440 [Bacteroidales bacterium]|nr:hypothetical protein [Bacteroidales bacterium]MCF8455744.1 hypothetical protein [Bacteroidales bacterium]